MKRFFGAWLACLCIFCIASVVKADVIWEPEDPFFEKHSEECEYISRVYTADGPDGEVIVYKTPESPKVMMKFENGEKIYIYWVYRDKNGISWGTVEDEKSGWVPMDYLTPVYDSISFQEEYETEITAQKGVLDEQYKDREIYIWEYPGSENVWAFDTSGETALPEYEKVYRDEEGRQWGNLGYYYGYENVWVCLDEPLKNLSELYPNGAPKHENPTGEKDFGAERIVPVPNRHTVIFAAVIVCVTVLVTVVLLAYFRRRTSKSK